MATSLFRLEAEFQRCAPLAGIDDPQPLATWMLDRLLSLPIAAAVVSLALGTHTARDRHRIPDTSQRCIAGR